MLLRKKISQVHRQDPYQGLKTYGDRMHTHKNYSLTKILNHGADLQFKNNGFYTGQYLEAHHSKVLEDNKILLKSNNINPLSRAPFQGPNLHSLIKGQTGPRNPRKNITHQPLKSLKPNMPRLHSSSLDYICWSTMLEDFGITGNQYS